MARWIINPVNPENNSNLNNVIYSVESLGVELVIHNYKPFGATEYNFFKSKEPTIFYGSLNFCKDAQKKRPDWFPFAWNNWHALSCKSYYSHWGEHILSEYGMFPFGELIRMKDFIYDAYSDGERIFIKPDENDKNFTGQLIAKNRLEDWIKIENSFGEIDKDCLCVVAKPVSIDREYRFIIADRKVLTGSQYKANRVLDVNEYYPDQAAEYAEIVANSTEWQPHSIYVMDIAKMIDGSFKLIEIGSVNCAGYYRSDIKKIIYKMNEIAEREFNENH